VHRKSIYCLIVAVAALIVIGCVMLFSTSTFAADRPDDPNFFIKRQIAWLAVGLTGCFIASRVDYHVWQRFAWPLYITAAVLLVLCFVPGIRVFLNGAHRWIRLGPVQFQPSEIAKLATVAALACWFSRDENDARTFLRGFLAPIGIACGLMALVAPEVDMGTTALIGATTLGVMFIAGTRLSIIAPLFVGGIATLLYVATHISERHARLIAFLDLEKYKDGAGLQQYQALVALGSGGVEGLGLGNGRQKMAYLTYAHTDFIFAPLGEELGLRCTLFVVFCFIVIVTCGAMVALRARDRFGLLLGFGVMLLIALQAAVNIGVTTAMLPNKGLPLPFISYGGTNLAFCLICVGILLNIYRQGLTEREVRHGEVTLAVKTRRRPVRL
jgi:cell division protein FtsW